MPAASPLLSSSQVAQRSQLSFRQVDLYRRAGVLRPAVQARGSGSRALYDPDELRVLAALRPLTRGLGRSPTKARLAAVADAVRRAPDARWLRLDGPAASAVLAPYPDGAVYLSVARPALALAPEAACA